MENRIILCQFIHLINNTKKDNSYNIYMKKQKIKLINFLLTYLIHFTYKNTIHKQHFLFNFINITLIILLNIAIIIKYEQGAQVMNIQMFNGWYFLFLILSIGIFVGIYFLLKNKKEKTIKIVLLSLLIFAVVLHFIKPLFPPYSTDESRMLRDSWFVNICAANIALFPIFFCCKNKHLKDYMFYLGVISGLLSIIYPMEPIAKSNQAGEWIDIIRFYIHHNILWHVPLLMVLLKIHKINYHRVWSTPLVLLLVMLFIMLNQIFQSELGFIPLRNSNMFDINYKNSSLIWGPDDEVGKILTWACPDVF